MEIFHFNTPVSSLARCVSFIATTTTRNNVWIFFFRRAREWHAAESERLAGSVDIRSRSRPDTHVMRALAKTVSDKERTKNEIIKSVFMCFWTLLLSFVHYYCSTWLSTTTHSASSPLLFWFAFFQHSLTKFFDLQCRKQAKKHFGENTKKFRNSPQWCCTREREASSIMSPAERENMWNKDNFQFCVTVPKSLKLRFSRPVHTPQQLDSYWSRDF